MQENGRNEIYSGKQASNKVPLLFSDMKMLEERFDRHLQMLEVNKQATVYVFSVHKPQGES